MVRFNLPDIKFADKSAQQIEADIVNRYEQSTNKRLAPADPKRLFIKALVSALTQQRSLIDFSAKQNLIGYSSGDYLEHLGAWNDTERLDPSFAQTTIRFHFSINQTQTIPVGTRGTAGGGIFFATENDVVVQSEQLYVDIPARCTQSGEIGNGYLPGEINELVDPIQWVSSIENITESEGGSDVEDDDSYASRIQNRPESFSTAGPTGAYEYWAKTANQTIVDVTVRSPSDGVIEIRPLLEDGKIPGQEILDDVLESCNDKKVRPLTDKVQVIAPEQVNYDIDLTYWISTTNSSIASSIQDKITKAIEDYKLWQKSKLGRDIDPSELITRVKNAGAKRAEVTLPAYSQILSYQVASENLETVTYGGIEDD